MGMFTGIVSMVLIAFTIIKVAQSQVGQAIARRISGKSGAGDEEMRNEVLDLREHVGNLEQRLAESEERIDFTERLLAQRGGAGAARGKGPQCCEVDPEGILAIIFIFGGGTALSPGGEPGGQGDRRPHPARHPAARLRPRPRSAERARAAAQRRHRAAGAGGFRRATVVAEAGAGQLPGHGRSVVMLQTPAPLPPHRSRRPAPIRISSSSGCRNR